MYDEIATGSAFPLGATVGGDSVNFAVYSKNACKVDLLFFDAVDVASPSQVISLDPNGTALTTIGMFPSREYSLGRSTDTESMGRSSLAAGA